MIILVLLCQILFALPLKRPFADMSSHVDVLTSFPNEILFKMMQYSSLLQSVRISKLLDFKSLSGHPIDWDHFNPLTFHDASLDHQWAIKNWSLLTLSDYFHLEKLSLNPTVDFKLLDNSILLDLIYDDQIGLLHALLKRGVEPDHWTLLHASQSSKKEILDLILNYF